MWAEWRTGRQCLKPGSRAGREWGSCGRYQGYLVMLNTAPPPSARPPHPPGPSWFLRKDHGHPSPGPDIC